MTFDQIKEIYNRPLLELIYQSSDIHRKNHQAGEVQVCTLLSVKTGGCTEDCAYCPQAARYHTDVKVHKLLDPEDVLNRAKEAKANGSTRFCMGAAWREVRDNRDFDNVLAMVREVNKLDMEVCCTLGMLSASQAEKLKEAGLTAYNHNIDTSEEYYDKVITTRTYEDRLETIHNVSKAGISVCSGGIIGLGEEEDARIGMIYTLANLPEPPESIPVNALVPVKGTPLENMERVSVWEMLRMIATIRIVVPKAMIRLSAGRNEMPISEQALCFIAGANSIFAGDKLLTTPNPAFTSDMEMFEILGLQPRVSFKNETQKEVAEVL